MVLPAAFVRVARKWFVGQGQDRDMAPLGFVQVSRGRASTFPLRSNVSSEFPQVWIGARDGVEGVVDGGMHAEEALGGFERSSLRSRRWANTGLFPDAAK